MSLWDLEFELDPVKALLLEGFSLPVDFSDLRPLTVVVSLSEASTGAPCILDDHTLFHPPISLV